MYDLQHLADEYFSPGTFSDDACIDCFFRGLLAYRLAVADEVPWLGATAQRPRCRIFASERFDFLVRIENNSQLVAKRIRLDVPGTYPLAEWSYVEYSRALTQREAHRLRKLTAAANLAALPVEDGSMGLDGYLAVVETIGADGYLARQRWCPKDAFGELFDWLIQLGATTARKCEGGGRLARLLCLAGVDTSRHDISRRDSSR